jgi:hypothetical protein
MATQGRRSGGEGKTPPAGSEPEVILTGLWGWITKSLGVPPWGQALTISLVVLFGLMGTELWHLESQFDRIDVTLTGLPDQIQEKVDRKLSDLRGDLIKEILDHAKDFAEKGNFEQAANAVKAATILTADATKEHLIEPTNFVDENIRALDDLSSQSGGPNVLALPVHQARLALAAYSSALLQGQLPAELRNPERFKKIPQEEIARLLQVGSGIVWLGNTHQDIVKIPPR